jgi:hypothetical protein
MVLQNLTRCPFQGAKFPPSRSILMCHDGRVIVSERRNEPGNGEPENLHASSLRGKHLDMRSGKSLMGTEPTKGH